MRKFFVFIIFLLPLSATSMETLFVSDEEVKRQKEICSERITEFKFYLRDAKKCRLDTDCMQVQGVCPIGCRFFITKPFEEIISTRIEQVADECSNSVCSATCPDAYYKPVCNNGRCEAKVVN